MATKTRKLPPKNKLLVEGAEDQRVIPYLIEANDIPWEDKNKQPFVYIESFDGIEKLLNKNVISTELKASGLSALGLMVDADDNSKDRWQSIRNVCLPSLPDFPENLPEIGLIHQTSFGVKFGVWVMPDNKISGMLETFLTYIIPDEKELLWNYAQTAVKEAKNQGAPFIENHTDKPNIHTWLAWQNTPGRQLHNAVMERILNPKHPQAQIFINWFKTLYDL
ncbi:MULTISPECIES: DUF3226 domain-containing protein [unclassified Okeania]|uniref:DUF3226 domain-containing protein n=1 Tax=unclassified Okeania TaxID=2634635 RepID=UPI0013BB2E22|nr:MULTISPECIES: DUF3226 domain-containing protein [unclassified Okeania]NES75247.1 hypothetical protein [Okeania sp. SIO1H4]NET12099.1 hypothetical protein [Okeania sp. SIO1H6]NET19293.1 hypothetical protein [Okeania sp. SIO1H5]NET92888.1 hypothetical protein [Okeania sp. SIO1H2]